MTPWEVFEWLLVYGFGVIMLLASALAVVAVITWAKTLKKGKR